MPSARSLVSSALRPFRSRATCVVREIRRKRRPFYRKVGGLYKGKVCYVVGRGPSLQWLTKASFSHGDGPVICINTAILAVQQLGLNNDIYSMQKDGCTSYHQRDVGCDGCDGEKGLMVYPNADVTLLLHEHESKNCLPNHESRIVFDSIEDLGFEWWMTSSPCAIRIAKIMGCSCIVLLCHDSLFNDLRTVETETGDMFELKQYPEHNYLGIIPLVEKELQGIAHEIVSPEETR